jgi:hypothetical protein
MRPDPKRRMLQPPDKTRGGSSAFFAQLEHGLYEGSTVSPTAFEACTNWDSIFALTTIRKGTDPAIKADRSVAFVRSLSGLVDTSVG